MPYAGQNQALDRRRHCRFRRASPLSVEPAPPAILRSIQARGEHPRKLLLLPGLFSPWFRGLRRRNAATPPWLPRATVGARRGGPLRALARRHREPHGRLGPLILPRTAAPPILPHRRRTPRAAALAPAPPRTPPGARAPGPRRARPARPPLAHTPAAARPAASPAGRRRRGPKPRPRRPPGLLAARAGEAGEQLGRRPLTSGARLSAPPFLLFYFI